MLQTMILGLLLSLSGGACAAAEILPGFSESLDEGVIEARDTAHVLEHTDVNDGVRPEFRHHVYALPRTQLFGVDVELRLQFFNGELMQIDVYPKQSEFAKIRADIAKFHEVSPEALPGGVEKAGFRLLAARNFEGKDYISISVVRVFSRFEAWIEQYS